MVRSPVEPVEGPFEPALALGERLENLEAGGNDLLADAVAGNDRNSIAPHDRGSGTARGSLDRWSRIAIRGHALAPTRGKTERIVLQ